MSAPSRLTAAAPLAGLQAGAAPDRKALAAAGEACLAAPLEGAEQAAFATAVRAQSGFAVDAGKAKALAKCAAEASRAGLPAGSDGARALKAALGYAATKLAGAQPAADDAAAAPAANPAALEGALSAKETALAALGDQRAGMGLLERAQLADGALGLAQQRFGLAFNTKPVDAGADAGGGAASFKEVYGILDMKGKAELKRRMAEDQSMVVSEAAKLEAQIKALELQVAKLKGQHKILVGRLAQPDAAAADEAADQKALGLLQAIEAVLPAEAAASVVIPRNKSESKSQGEATTSYLAALSSAVLAKQAQQQVLRKRLHFCVEQLALFAGDMELAPLVSDPAVVEAHAGMVDKLEAMLGAVIADANKLEAEVKGLSTGFKHHLGLIQGSAAGRGAMRAVEGVQSSISQVYMYHSLLMSEADSRQLLPEEYFANATSLPPLEVVEEEPAAKPAAGGAPAEAPKDRAPAPAPAKKDGKAKKKTVAPATPPASNPWNKTVVMTNGDGEANGDYALFDGPALGQ